MPIISPSSLPLHELALFAGAGGGILGGNLLGWRTVCAVEWDAYARDVLVARQNDGCLAPFPIWDDVRTFDGTPWQGSVDVVSGGFPCQDISAAGKGAGIEGVRSGRWKHMARIIGEILPQIVWVENSGLLVGRGLAMVLGDLTEMGYDAVWGIVGARHAGAPHLRERIWILAYPNGTRREKLNIPAVATRSRQRDWACDERECPDPNSNGRPTRSRDAASEESAEHNGHHSERLLRDTWWRTQSAPPPVAYGVANRLDQLRCTGNGQVPSVVPLAWNFLTQKK
jgi:DNA (cytosine-5)-methyltransferase 1